MMYELVKYICFLILVTTYVLNIFNACRIKISTNLTEASYVSMDVHRFPFSLTYCQCKENSRNCIDMTGPSVSTNTHNRYGITDDRLMMN